MRALSDTAGKILYGILFLLVLPALLILWAKVSAANVPLPAIQSAPLGVAAAAFGSFLVVAGMFSLIVYGKALPMNPYPPATYVTRGVYRFIPHPIYTGFGMLCIGCAIGFGSASGLWLVTPVAILACVALVLGYERIDLRQRFGSQLPQPLLHFPANTDNPPSLEDRLSVYVMVLLPWLVLYEGLAGLGVPSDAIIAYVPFETKLPVIEWTEVLYLGTYIFVNLAPAIASTRRALRDFATGGMIATLLMPLFFVSIPLIAPPRPFVPSGLPGELLMLERSLDTPSNAFPSYHVTWILLATAVFAKRMPRARFAWWTLGAAVSLSCLTTGMHAIVDIVGGVILWFMVSNVERIWDSIRRSAERVANSWKEWHWGNVRLINHGLYAGIGSFLAVTIVGFLIGPENALSAVFVASCALVLSALWAQVIEGSPSLLRPYGYYGGVLGIVIGSILAWPLFGTDPWLLLAAYSIAGPWVQSFGRVRCLVQGCCHGSEAPPTIGIVYHHPRTRVCRLAGLQGVPIHPTPVYSILWNIVIAALLTRFWFAHAPLSIIGGLYLILTGLGRFVEEAYRGEPQTHTMGGLRFYQWIGVLTVVGGAVITCVRTEDCLGDLTFSLLPVGVAVIFGAVTWFALGVDFPKSNRRFARLV